MMVADNVDEFFDAESYAPRIVVKGMTDRAARGAILASINI